MGLSEIFPSHSDLEILTPEARNWIRRSFPSVPFTLSIYDFSTLRSISQCQLCAGKLSLNSKWENKSLEICHRNRSKNILRRFSIRNLKLFKWQIDVEKLTKSINSFCRTRRFKCRKSSCKQSVTGSAFLRASYLRMSFLMAQQLKEKMKLKLHNLQFIILLRRNLLLALSS